MKTDGLRKARTKLRLIFLKGPDCNKASIHSTLRKKRELVTTESIRMITWWRHVTDWLQVAVDIIPDLHGIHDLDVFSSCLTEYTNC